METNYIKLKEQVELVKNKMLNKFPDCHYTIRILLWDDNTTLVECRHGCENKLHNFTFYNNELKYEESKLNYNAIIANEVGNETPVIN